MLRNGALSNEPFLITRTWPPWRQTKSRPSGANAIAVGVPDRSLPTCASKNPGGKLAAMTGKDIKVSEAAMNAGIDFKPGPRTEDDRFDFTSFWPYRTNRDAKPPRINSRRTGSMHPRVLVGPICKA